MKKVNKVISFLLAFIMLFTSTGVYASTKTRSKYTGITYTHNSKFKNKELVYGMDVSQHNGKINFKLSLCLFVWDTRDIQNPLFRLIWIRSIKHILRTQQRQVLRSEFIGILSPPR